MGMYYKLCNPTKKQYIQCPVEYYIKCPVEYSLEGCNWKHWAFLKNSHCSFALLPYLLINNYWNFDEIGMSMDEAADLVDSSPWNGDDWVDATQDVLKDWSKNELTTLRDSPFSLIHPEYTEFIINKYKDE